MYKLNFNEGELGEKRFMLCFEALLSQRENVAVENWETTVDLIKKFRSIGFPKGEKIGGKIQLYELDKDGLQKLELEKAEYKLLLKDVEAPIWLTYVLEDVMEVTEWLKSLKYDGSQDEVGAARKKKNKDKVD